MFLVTINHVHDTHNNFQQQIPESQDFFHFQCVTYAEAQLTIINFIENIIVYEWSHSDLDDLHLKMKNNNINYKLIAGIDSQNYSLIYDWRFFTLGEILKLRDMMAEFNEFVERIFTISIQEV